MINKFHIWVSKWKWQLIVLIGVGFSTGIEKGAEAGIMGVLALFMLAVAYHTFLILFSMTLCNAEFDKIVFYELSALAMWYGVLIYLDKMVVVLMSLVISVILSLAVVFMKKSNS